MMVVVSDWNGTPVTHSPWWVAFCTSPGEHWPPVAQEKPGKQQ